ncbi:MAG: tetratricopeptide repeat protein [Steroidobacteraceae bacterium]
MHKYLLAATLSMGAAIAFCSPVFADSTPGTSDPTMNQIYEAASSGHMDQAQQMITQVLADHPNSAKAHYVQAELYAKQGRKPLARSELSIAESLNPGLTSFSQRSVQELKSQLGLSYGTRAADNQGLSLATRPASHFPWGTLLILAVVAGVLLMLFRRRAPYAQYPAASGPAVGGAPGAYPPGYGPAPMGGGLGSGIAGGLASGLAVGAGVVAGEELAHHFLDGGRHEGGVIPPADAAEPSSNSDMGGADFGANDPGSWDDGGSGGGGDWN